MFGRRFYHESLRKVVVSFGTIFNNIVIHRTNSDGDVIQKLKVPLAYSPKEKFLVRLEQQPSLETREMAITLPRMGFEISGITYDATRKLQRVGKFKAVNTTDANKQYYQYNPVPYNISFNLYSFTATAEDGLQIVEQILPYFQPDYTVTVNMVPNLDIKRDIPIVLGNINYEDSYDGEFTNRRAVIYTINFTAKTYLFGPMNNQGVIKKAQADLGADTDPQLVREERVVVLPSPETADADDDFGFTTTIDFFTDGKRYDPSSGSDT